MSKKSVMLVLSAIWMTLIIQSYAVYLPETRRLDTIEEPIQQQKQQRQPHHQQYDINQLNIAAAATAIREEKTNVKQRHAKSYDKNDDVLIVNVADDDDYHYNNHDDDDDVDEYDANVMLEQREETEEQVYENNLEASEQQQVSDEDEEEEEQQHLRKKRNLSDWLIAPNTRWCGRGNTANGTYNHLGGASAADKCCRKHDHCQLFISGMSNRYELFNYRPYTLSHCNCDRRFRTCLKMANDEDAKTIGKLFFNMVQTQCFVLHSEKICQERDADGVCAREYVKQKAYLKNNRKF